MISDDSFHQAVVHGGPFPVIRQALDERGFDNLEQMWYDRRYRDDLEEAIEDAVLRCFGSPLSIADLPKRLTDLTDYDLWRSIQKGVLRAHLPKVYLLLGQSLRFLEPKDRAAALKIVSLSKVPAFVQYARNSELSSRISRQEQAHVNRIPMTTSLRSRNLQQFAHNRDVTRKWTVSHTRLRNQLHSKEPSDTSLQTRDAMIRYFLRAGMRAPKRPRGFQGVYLYRGTEATNPMLAALQSSGVYEEKSFASFSWTEELAKTFGDTIIRLKFSDIKRGTPYVWFGVGDVISHIKGEEEVLLPHGTFRLLGRRNETFDVSFEAHI